MRKTNPLNCLEDWWDYKRVVRSQDFTGEVCKYALLLPNRAERVDHNFTEVTGQHPIIAPPKSR